MYRLRVEVVGDGQTIPLLVNAPAPTALDRWGVMRLVNHAEAGEAWLYARRDDDVRPVAVVVGERSVAWVDARGIAEGERGERVYGELPVDDASLEVYSSTDIKAYAYVRTADGFLTSVHDTASEGADGRHAVPFFNPAGDMGQSLLRVINVGKADANVSIVGIDDTGASGGPVTLVVPVGAATVIDASALEGGADRLSGSLGDGTGMWRLELSSDEKIAVVSLLENPTGHLTNVSTSAEDLVVPLFPSTSHPNRRGRVRIVNRGLATTVEILGVDDAGTMSRSVTVGVQAGHAFDFSSEDFERGNAAKGLPRGVGAGHGEWRLRLSSAGDVQVSAYVETDDGFVSSVHASVPAETEPPLRCPWWLDVCVSPADADGRFYTVAPFEPMTASNVASSVRLVNDDDERATVVIWGVDRRLFRASRFYSGALLPGWLGWVRLELAPGTARNLTARELQNGREGLTGSLSGGEGPWELYVWSSSERVMVVNLLEDESGHMTNLSSAPVHPILDEFR